MGMTRTPDEIKKGLECRIRSYKDVCDHQCETCDLRIPAYSIFERHEDALALIQQLEADNAQLNRCIENMTDKLNAANDEVAKLQAERDAAVKDIQAAKPCRICKNIENDPVCAQCSVAGRNFEWRGVQEEE